MPNSTDPKRPSRITPVFVAVCVIAVVFLIVGSILLAFLTMGGANALPWALWPSMSWRERR